MSEFETKDSGKRVEYPSGLRRDIQDGKPRYDLIPLMPLRRLAELYARGAVKYGDSNWKLANSQEELDRFKQSAMRHMFQWAEGDTSEDHASAVTWNLFAYLEIEAKLELIAPMGISIDEYLERETKAYKPVGRPKPTCPYGSIDCSRCLSLAKGSSFDDKRPYGDGEKVREDG